MHERNAINKANNDLVMCSFPNWHKLFAKISMKSICIRIPDDVKRYLLDEMMILPKECMSEDQLNEVHVGYEEEDTENLEPPEFPEFSKLITEKLDELGGSAFLKTNWRSPKDSCWITAGQTMKVKDINDVYQLLKASSLCQEDLTQLNASVDDGREGSSSTLYRDSFLVFKKWREIHPGTEFRCFVRNKNLIGISPRDWPQYHAHILTQNKDIVNDIKSMFKEHIKTKFSLNDYIFDVVRDTKDRVYLMDFSPFHEKWSQPLAFTWDELLELTEDDDEPELRYLNADCGIQPRESNNYGIPTDVIEAIKASYEEGENSLNEFLASRLSNIVDSRNRENENDVNES
ncbi:Cell division cycle protein 123 like [Pseudolycoriella hygida]|uniref:Cell division cycle protein 123 like n=1 Tax=Pseudolycoriella hygida TaxID=35572 RepID=A0A9Q0MUY8_9DIPT|nr:Cell division cycle protein 123 like [Pseudolycoriella hygida]